MTEENILTGRLDVYGVPQLLYSIYINRQNGHLLLVDGASRIHFYFFAGNMIFAKSNLESQYLAHFLIQDGLATEYQLKVIGKPLPKIHAHDLVERNMMTLNEAQWWQKILMRDIVYTAFHWVEGGFKYDITKELDQRFIRTAIDTWNLVESTLNQINNLPVIQHYFGSIEAIPTINRKLLANPKFLPIKLRPQDGYVLSRIDGKTSLREIVTLSGPNKLDSWKFLLLAKIIKLIDLPESRMNLDVHLEPFQLSKSELSSIKLTSEEMSILDEENIRQRDEERSKIGLDVKTSYLRDGQYVEEAVDSKGAVDVDAMKGKKTKEEEAAEDKIIYIIDGEEVDGESELLYGRGKSGDRDQFATLAQQQHKTIEEMWEEWIANKNREVSEETKDDDVEKRWDDWVQLEEERNILEDRIYDLNEEIGKLSDHDQYYQQQKEEMDQLQERLTELNNMKKLQIVYFYRRSTLRNHYDFFLVDRTAPIETINEAYYRWSKEFNPEGHSVEELGAVWEMINGLHEHIQQAYEILSNPEKRSEYDMFLEEQEKALKFSEERRFAIAEKNFQLAQEALVGNDLWRGCEYLRAAISLNSKEPRYYLGLADTLSANPKWYWEAMKNYNLAIKSNPTNPHPYYQIGKLFSKWGRVTLAEKSFHLALRFDPHFTGAIHELKKLESRRIPQPPS